jgi:hypothetical protein
VRHIRIVILSLQVEADSMRSFAWCSRLLCALVIASGVGIEPAHAQEDKDLRRFMQALEKARNFNDAARARDSIGALGGRAIEGLPGLVRFLDHKEFYVRYGALQALQKLGPAAAPATPLVLPRLQDTSAGKRTDAVDILLKIARETAGPALAALARTDPSPYVRSRALPAVTSADTLSLIIRTDTHTALKQSAVRQLSDQRVLGELAKANLGLEMTDAILEKVTDRDVILDLVRAGPSALRFDALAKLPSFVVADIATKHADPLVRLDAVWVATDAAALAAIGANDADPAVREAAKLSARGKPTDLKVTGLDCKPEPTASSRSYICALQIVNGGAVAYTDLRFVLGITDGFGSDARDGARRLEGSVQPGETKEFTARFTSSSTLGNTAQFRLAGMRKTAPAR